MARNKKLINYLQNEIRMRYAPDSILPYDDNKIIHRLVDENASEISAKEVGEMRIMNQNLIQMSKQLMIHKSAPISSIPESFINPLTQELLDKLDIRPTVEDLQRIKNKKVKLCVVGYGGAMLNMLYNMYLWSMELSVTRPFEKLVIFEKDYIDFSNIARMGKPIVNQYHPDFLIPYDEKVPNIKTLRKLFLLDVENHLCKDQKPIVFEDWLEEASARKIEERGYVFVGAPTLDTREMLQDKNFYFMGHGDFEVEITYRPQITSGLANETYGSIDIPALLINLQLSTAAFIKELASDEPPQTNQPLFSFDMKKFIEEEGVKHV